MAQRYEQPQPRENVYIEAKQQKPWLIATGNLFIFVVAILLYQRIWGDKKKEKPHFLTSRYEQQECKQRGKCEMDITEEYIVLRDED